MIWMNIALAASMTYQVQTLNIQRKTMNEHSVQFDVLSSRYTVKDKSVLECLRQSLRRKHIVKIVVDDVSLGVTSCAL